MKVNVRHHQKRHPFHYRYFSWSHHYTELGNALKKTFFTYSTLIMGTLKGSTGQLFNFSAQSKNLTGALNGPDLP